jgi:hypothetical protein
MDDTAVARAGAKSQLGKRFKQKDIFPLLGQSARDRAANHAAADDYNVCLVDGQIPLVE